MPVLKSKRGYLALLTPVFGSLLFIILYIVAALLYPGGSQADASSKGFSWINNYWCDLLAKRAENGEPNASRAVAIAGMAVLCFTLAFFWYIFPRHIPLKKSYRIIMQFSGVFAMAFIIFLFTGYHDAVINISAFFGVIAVTGNLIGLYKKRWYGLFTFGLFNLLLVALNNYVYYTKELIIYLPLVQKVSFASFLLWICWMDLRIYRLIRTTVTY